MKILLAVVDGGGNIPPQLAVARALRARGDEVHFVGHEGVRQRVRAEGFSFETFTTGSDFDPIAQRSIPAMLRDMTKVITDRRLGRDVAGAAQRHGADVVVVDVLLTAALPEVAAAQLPTVVFVHCFYRAIQDQAVGPIGWLLRLRGVAPLGAERSGALQIVTARADLDPVRGRPPVRHVGIVWQGLPTAAQAMPVPRILVSLSSCAYAGQAGMLQNILDAIEPLPLEATVTVGPAIDASGVRVPVNASMHAWLDHDDVLATASLVVGHGGHSTTMRALSFGVPVVILPANTLIDQKRVGAAVQKAGAGVRLRKHASVRRIREAVSKVLSDGSYRIAAGRLGEQIRASDGAEVAADAISRYAKAYAGHMQGTERLEESPG